MNLQVDANQVNKILKEYAQAKGFETTDKTHVKPDDDGGFTIYGLEDLEISGQVEEYADVGA